MPAASGAALQGYITADVFISYSRRDGDFVRRLHNALTEAGRDVWVDWEGIPPSAEWMAEVKRAIESAESFVLVVSPDSLASSVCREELDAALEQNKRLIPVVRRDVPPADAPEKVAAANWIFFREEDDFDHSLGLLVSALDTDLDWVRAHTRLLVRANEWEQRGKDASFLLRGRDLRAAEEAVAGAADKEPRPTSLQTEYVLAGRRGSTRRQRLAILAALAVAAISIGLGALALLQRNEARTQSDLAFSRELASVSQQVRAENPVLALLLATRAAEQSATGEAQTALTEALRRWPVLRAMQSLEGKLQSVSLSPGRRFAVTAGSRNVVRLWDLATGRSRVLARDLPLAQRAVFSPNGKLVLVPGDGGARLLPVARDGRPVVLPQRGKLVVTAAFGANGRLIITGDTRGDARVWDTATRRTIAKLPGRARQLEDGLPTQPVADVAVSPDGSHAATAFGSETTYVWTLPEAKFVAKLAGSTVAFSPNGGLLALGNTLRVRLWDVARGQSLGVLPEQPAPIRSVAFNAAGTRVLTASDDGSARIVDVARRQQVASLLHGAPVSDAVFSRDDEVVATVDATGNLTIWEPDPGAPATRLARAATAFAFLPNGLVTVVDGAEARVTDDRVGAVVTSLPARAGETLDMDVSADGTSLVTVGSDGIVQVWDAATAKRLWSAKEPDEVHGIRFTTDGKRFATANEDGHARIYDLAARRLVRSVSLGPPLAWARTTTGGRYLFTGTTVGSDAVMVVSRNGRPVVTHPSSAAGVSRNGARFALSTLVDLRVRDVASWREFVLPMSTPGAHLWPTFSADGSLLFAGGANDHVARVWDLEERRLLAEVKGDATAFAGAFSPDKRLVAVGRDDGSLDIWEIATRRTVLSLKLAVAVWDVQFSPLGDAVAVLDSSGAVRLVPCDVCRPAAELLAIARERAPRSLTADERALYLHE